MPDASPTILSQLELSDQQETAALSAAPAVAVTAGAGSGKTRTLVGRYLWLVEEGYTARSLVAITFTEKAAREMRNRIREEIGEWRKQALPEEQKLLWDRAASELDAARIGTIHGLCASLLRNHPAEAGVDPMFEVLEENTAILLQVRAVEDVLAWAIDDPVCGRLFGPLSEQRLRSTITNLLQRRLDAQPAFLAVGDDALQHWSDAVAGWFDAQLVESGWQQPLHDLVSVSARRTDDKLELARQVLLGDWAEVQVARAAADWEQVIDGLVAMRKSIKTNVGAKGNWSGDDLKVAKDAMQLLRQYYDERFKPLLGSGAGAPPSDWAYDRLAANLVPGLQRLFDKGIAIYEGMKADRQALDFDDLESKAATLLVEHPAVCARWQNDITAVLVDEFQDTNARQREIIYRITGFLKKKILDNGYSVSPTAEVISNTQYPLSNLFIVGDGKQSIYRFRGADVSVFRQVQDDICQTGGQLADLDTTYRAHRPLLETLNNLLAPILGEEEDPDRPYHTPFAPLHAFRQEPESHIQSPFLEFHLGLGSAEEGRAAAASGLAERLHELHQQGSKWGDMALLFRASTAFGVYEDALEAAGIPFVTVAGRGFYDRPEVRDVLNALTAIADPTDDVAMAGLLRSPAFGLSDSALFQLRWSDESTRKGNGFWQALTDDYVLAVLDRTDAAQAVRAREIVGILREQAGRTPVAVVLKELLDLTYYRAALHHAKDGERIWRNVDKLLADAHRSRLVGIGDFLEYVRSLRDVAAREGEAPTEAGNAVQLMTVHKAKGLEFPIVVIADASRSARSSSPPLLLDAELGPLLRVQQEHGDKTSPLTYQLVKQRHLAMDEAESRRLLYVAATRAQEKLLVSGYCKIGAAKRDPGKLQLAGWLQWLGDVVGISELRYPDPPTSAIFETLPWQSGSTNLWLYPFVVGVSAPSTSDSEIAPLPTSDLRPPASDSRPLDFDLIAPLPEIKTAEEIDRKLEDEEADPPPRVWRVIPKTRRARPPSWVVGVLVHRALQHWYFPNRPGFTDFLRPFALESGLTSEQEIENAIREAGKLMKRFQAEALYTELNQAERYHEVPYSIEVDGEIDSGIIDLLARSAPDAPWKIVDFKTDSLRSDVDIQAQIVGKKYNQQIERYILALEKLHGQEPEAILVFLDVEKKVKLVPC